MALKHTTFLLYPTWRNLGVLCHRTPIQTMNCCLIIDPAINHNYLAKACWHHWHQRTAQWTRKQKQKKSISSPQPQRWRLLIKNLFSNLASGGLTRQPPANEKPSLLINMAPCITSKYWIYKISGFLFFKCTYFKYLLYFSAEKWYKLWAYLHYS